MTDTETLRRALEKIRSYNVDIAAGRINYRPEDHIEVIDAALATQDQPASPSQEEREREDTS
jgi:hypothetical protein